jgi:hypothetical protein
MICYKMWVPNRYYIIIIDTRHTSLLFYHFIPNAEYIINFNVLTKGLSKNIIPTAVMFVEFLFTCLAPLKA